MDSSASDEGFDDGDFCVYALLQHKDTVEERVETALRPVLDVCWDVSGTI